MLKKGKRWICFLMTGLLTLPVGVVPLHAQELSTSSISMEKTDMGQLSVGAKECQVLSESSGEGIQTYDVRDVGEETDPENFRTSGSDDALVIEDYNGTASVVDLTKIFEGKTVTSISYSAFQSNQNLQKVVIPASVTMLGNSVFHNCQNLTTVSFGEGEISLTSIGENAFGYCEKLKEFHVPASVMAIGNDAFRYSGIAKIEFEEGSSLDAIGTNVFYECKNLTEIVIPSSVETIGKDAFYLCESLMKVSFEQEESSLTSIGEGAFYCCKSLAQFTFPSTVKSIGAQAFYGTALTAISLPDAVTQIGQSAFFNCRSLASVSFGKNSVLNSIGEQAFYKCSVLSSLSFPASLSQIGSEAFSYCENLGVVSFGNPNTVLGQDALPSDSEEKKLTIYSEPNGSVEQYARENGIRFNRFMKNMVLESMPDKTEYMYGDSFNTAGMALRVEYVSDAEPTSEVLSASEIEKSAVITGFDSNHPGKQTITVSYGGKTVSFEIYVYYNMANVEVSADNSYLTYTGDPVLPEFTLISEESEITLHEDSDYEISLSENHVDAGKVTATFTGKGSYKGKVSHEYTIQPKSLSDNDISVKVEDMEYTGEQRKPQPVISYAGKEVSSKNYTVTYGNNVEVGTGSVSIVGQGNFSGSVQKSFQIKPKDIGTLTIRQIADQYYTGYEIRPAVRVEINAYTPLVLNVDYTVKYRNNTAIGTAYVLIEGKGTYTGSVERSFRIVEPKKEDTPKKEETPKPDDTLQKGAIYTVGAYKYQVTNQKEVAFYGLEKAKLKKVKIPANVTIKGRKMNITSIAKGALYGKSSVKEVIIGKNVKTIGANAFAYCRNLNKIQVKSSKLKKIGKAAFNGISVKAKIKVPAKKLSAYKKLWKGKGQNKKVKIGK